MRGNRLHIAAVPRAIGISLQRGADAVGIEQPQHRDAAAARVSAIGAMAGGAAGCRIGAETLAAKAHCGDGIVVFKAKTGAVRGYAGGWWRLASGEKSLLYLTAPDRVAYVPTTEGFSLLLSVSDPERFVEQLRRVAPAG